MGGVEGVKRLKEEKILRNIGNRKANDTKMSFQSRVFIKSYF